MRHTTFQTVASKLAATIGRERGVKVTYGGTGAWATPGHIHLPALPAGTVLSPFEADVMRGYLDHEVGHIRWTDFKMMLKEKGRLDEHPGLMNLWNIIEDVWQENQTLESYPGSLRFLNTTHGFMDEVMGRKSQERLDAGEPVILADLALRLIYRECWKFRDLNRDVGSDVTLKELDLEKIQELIDERFPHLTNSQECFDLAVEIYDILKDEVENFEPPPEPGPGEEGEDGEPSDDEGEGSGGGGGAGDGDPGDEKGEGSGGPGGDEDGDGEGAGDGADGDGKAGPGGSGPRAAKPTEGGDLGDGTGTPEHQQVLERLLERIVGKNSGDEKRKVRPTLVSEPDPAQKNNPGEFVQMHWEGDDYLPPAGTEHDRIFVPSRESLDDYREIRATMAGEISSIKKALTIFLRSREMKAWTRGLEEGRLDEDALAGLCTTGDTRVFKQRRTRQFPNTAFAVMVDQSSSMNAFLVRTAAVAFAEALSQLPRIKTQIAGFRTTWQSYEPSLGSGRLDAIDIELFKGFDEPFRNAAPRLGAVETQGGTPLGDGYAYGFESLVKRPETRKVLLVLTDGEPCYSCSHDHGFVEAAHNDFALMGHIHQKCRTYGIETLGIGMPAGRQYGNGVATGLKPYVDLFEIITSQTELARAVLEMTKRVVVP